jgi:hypothetical protein
MAMKGAVCKRIYDEVIAENEKLKEENKKWESWASEVIYWSYTETKNVLEEKKLITADNKPTIANVRDFDAEIKELKLDAEKLKEEIKELKLDAENSKAFWECFMDCKGNPDNPTKLEMIAWCDDNNKSDEIREYIMECADYDDSDDEDSDDEEINKLIEKYTAMTRADYDPKKYEPFKK